MKKVIDNLDYVKNLKRIDRGIDSLIDERVRDQDTLGARAIRDDPGKIRTLD
jgi:hypothetical protein